MKKSLILLPFAAVMLAGCGQGGGQPTSAAPSTPTGPVVVSSGTPTPTTGTSQGGHEVDVDSFSIDWTNTKYKDEKVTPYIENNDIVNFTTEGFTWNDRGCFASAGYDGAPNYLMMKTKAYGEPDGTFIGNHDKFAKTITAVSMTTPATGSSAKTEYVILMSTSEITSITGGDVVGSGLGGNSVTISATADASKGYKYFAVFAKFDTSKALDKQTNGQMAALSVTLVA